MRSVESRAAQWASIRHDQCENVDGKDLIATGMDICRPLAGWSHISIPDKQTLISDAGKLFVLDGLLTRLKAQNHRVLIYSQMTKVIDLLEVSRWLLLYFFFKIYRQIFGTVIVTVLVWCSKFMDYF